MARAPLPIEMALGWAETPDERYEIFKQLGWLTPRGLAERTAVTALLIRPPDHSPAPGEPVIIGSGGPSWVENALDAMYRQEYLDADLCLCFTARTATINPTRQIVEAFRASGGRGIDDSTVLLPLTEIFCSGPDMCRQDSQGSDRPPAPSSDPACQLTLESPPHQVLAFAYTEVLAYTTWRPRRGRLTDEDLDTPLRDLAHQLETIYRERWAPPWRATNPVRVRLFKAAYDERWSVMSSRITASFAPLHDLMERRFGTGRIDTALLVHFPKLSDRVIGDTTLRDYIPTERRFSIGEWKRAVGRRLEATFGQEYRHARA